MIKTIKDFIARVDSLDDISEAYDVFEDECTDELRDHIYRIAEGSVEPFRAAMHNLGFTTY